MKYLVIAGVLFFLLIACTVIYVAGDGEIAITTKNNATLDTDESDLN